MNEIFVPTLHSFENKNSFSGSYGMLRFMLTPVEDQIEAKIWHGLFCLEKSEVEDTAMFFMTEEGLKELRAYLESKI